MVEAEMGLMHITGERDGPPVKVGVAVTDLTTGMYTAIGVLASLYARRETGLGQWIDASLSDCQVAGLANIASSGLVTGKKDSGRWGTAHGKPTPSLFLLEPSSPLRGFLSHHADEDTATVVPYRAYKSKDTNIAVGGCNDKLYGILCEKINKPEWKTDPRFVTNALRVKNRDTLDRIIEDELKTKTTKEWLEIFEGSGMPYAAVNDIQGTLNHEHGMFMIFFHASRERVGMGPCSANVCACSSRTQHDPGSRPPSLRTIKASESSSQVLEYRTEDQKSAADLGRTYG